MAPAMESSKMPSEILILFTMSHSLLKALIGSTLVARSASMAQARIIANSTAAADMKNACRSIALTPKTAFRKNKAPQNVKGNPTVMPTTPSQMPNFKTSFATSALCAPTAKRMPISRVHPATR